MNLMELIIFYNKNDKEFEAIYDRFKKKIDFLISSFNIELYRSDVLLFFWKLTKKIDVSNFISEKALYAYISISLKNYCINIYMKYCKNQRITFNSELTIIELDKKYLCNSIDKSTLIFDDLISKLSENQKKVITMRYKYGMSDVEIAKKLQVSRQAIYKNRKEALGRLRNII